MSMSRLQPALAAADRWQQRTIPIGFGIGVVKKFGDDRCSSLGAELTYYGFLSRFPLLLLTTFLRLVSGADPSFARRVESSALSKFPVVGGQLGANIHPNVHGSAVALAVGIVAWPGVPRGPSRRHSSRWPRYGTSRAPGARATVRACHGRR